MAKPADPATQLLGPIGIKFDSNNFDPTPGQGERDRTETRTELDDELPRPEIGLGDEEISALGKKEVLTETATALVPLCPRFRGHGGSLP